MTNGDQHVWVTFKGGCVGMTVPFWMTDDDIIKKAQSKSPNFPMVDARVDRESTHSPELRDTLRLMYSSFAKRQLKGATQ